MIDRIEAPSMWEWDGTFGGHTLLIWRLYAVPDDGFPVKFEYKVVAYYDKTHKMEMSLQKTFDLLREHGATVRKVSWLVDAMAAGELK